MALENLLMMLALVRSPMRDMLSARPSISHSLLPEGGLPFGVTNRVGPAKCGLLPLAFEVL